MDLIIKVVKILFGLIQYRSCKSEVKFGEQYNWHAVCPLADYESSSDSYIISKRIPLPITIGTGFFFLALAGTN